ncbi:MAG: hypothetical protein ACJ79M_02350, partial [Myxococcales bacterium]
RDFSFRKILTMVFASRAWRGGVPDAEHEALPRRVRIDPISWMVPAAVRPYDAGADLNIYSQVSALAGNIATISLGTTMTCPWGKESCAKRITLVN